MASNGSAWWLIALILSSCQPADPRRSPSTRAANLETAVRWLGRVDAARPEQPAFDWSGSGFEARFRGSGLTAELSNDDAFVFLVLVDGQRRASFTARPGRHRYTLASALANSTHELALVRQTEAQMGATRLFRIDVQEGTLLAPGPAKTRAIELVGDSISCGYGNLGTHASCPYDYATQSHWDSYGAIAARRFGADLSTVGVSGGGVSRNLDGVTVDTLPMLYDRAVYNDARQAWRHLRSPDVVVIELGTNDLFAVGEPGLAFGDEYRDFLARLRTLHPGALLVCAIGPMTSDAVPPSGGRLARFRKVVSEVIAVRSAQGDHNLALLEFPLEKPDELGCDYHPNVRKHLTMADQLITLLSTRLGW